MFFLVKTFCFLSSEVAVTAGLRGHKPSDLRLGCVVVSQSTGSFSKDRQRSTNIFTNPVELLKFALNFQAVTIPCESLSLNVFRS